MFASSSTLSIPIGGVHSLTVDPQASQIRSSSSNYYSASTRSVGDTYANQLLNTQNTQWRGGGVSGSSSLPTSPNDDFLNNDPASIGTFLTPSEVREERELERTRRRMALRKKAQRLRTGGGGARSGGPSGASSPNPLMHGQMTPNDLMHVHPSLQHSLAASSAAAASSASHITPLASPSASHRISPAPFLSSRRPLTTTRVAVSSSAIGAFPSSSQQDSHHIDIPPEPDDDSTILERTNDSVWSTIKDWDASQRSNAIAWCATIQCIIGIALFLICLSTLSTTFANPGVHWSAMCLSIATCLIGLFLRCFALQRSSGRIDLCWIVMWIVCTTILLAGFILLSILSFHHNRESLDFRVRQEWMRMDALETENEYHASYEEMKDRCLLHLTAIGSSCIFAASVMFTLLCIVSTIRSHIISETSHSLESSSRRQQYTSRLHQRQRLARLNEQMKSRRQLRRERGRQVSNTVAFTGVGSQPLTGSWSDSSVMDETPVGGQQQGQDVEMMSLNMNNRNMTMTMNPMHSQSSHHNSNADHDHSSLVTSALLHTQQDAADEQRYAGMLSEDVEADMERRENVREQRLGDERKEER